MSPIVATVNTTTMTSREIAELTGKEHRHVLADARVMLESLGIDCAGFSAQYKDASGKANPMFILPKRETLILVSGYSVAMRAKIIDRWQELEAQAVPAIPNFSNPAEAARAWAIQYEARVLAETTKAQIGDKKVATAMNTASHAVKRANKLEIELDRSKDYASIKRMETLYGTPFNWRLLKSAASDLGIPSVDVFDANYGTVKSYHASVWREAYALSIDGGVTA